MNATPNIDAMVNRFLAWRLPQGFYPDCYISFDRENASQRRRWPTGTNLLTAEQAREMLEHVVGFVETQDKRPVFKGALASSVCLISKAMCDDLDYAWGWHCSIAMSAVDAGCPHDVANEGAARFLQLLAGVDTRKHPAFEHTQRVKTAPDQRPKTDAAPASIGETAENKQLAELSAESADQEDDDWQPATETPFASKRVPPVHAPTMTPVAKL